ncbi:uncharacterized protein (TIGR02588 family) [Neorhizobium huautlense]|uniref:Uncharacterized protein (TIGR02588 family) n=1 Tax=Neorhizobium huautlense TaxID=67774 RepID=A0ABT9PZZ9_9HYPH|nr:TIGR02588 family protein [Neorhizobium huautlense]MDP9840053.1 uncharacterized protein (TIGR02588 family) [Neorhizobium huautlense]
MTEISRRPHSEKPDPHWVEWATGIVSAVLVVAMLGWVGYEALTDKDGPPEFRITITGIAPVSGGHRVEFDIANRATRTAATVNVRGEILDGSRTAEDAEVVIDYVPAQSKSSGALIFREDPGRHEILIRAVGYSDP